MRLLFSLALTAFASTANAQTADIKGVKYGLSLYELARTFESLEVNSDRSEAYIKGFTVAGATAKYSVGANVRIIDDKVEGFTFFFDPKGFEEVRTALKEKYPKLACRDSSTRTNAGVEHTQTACTLTDTSSVLTLRRYVTDIETSSLAITSNREMQEAEARREKRKKDI